MSNTSKSSKWYSTPNSERNRPSVRFTLSRAAKQILIQSAKRLGLSRSQLVEQLIIKHGQETKEDIECLPSK